MPRKQHGLLCGFFYRIVSFVKANHRIPANFRCRFSIIVPSSPLFKRDTKHFFQPTQKKKSPFGKMEVPPHHFNAKLVRGKHSFHVAGWTSTAQFSHAQPLSFRADDGRPRNGVDHHALISCGRKIHFPRALLRGWCQDQANANRYTFV